MEDPEALKLRVGRRIAELRQRSGMTQEELAEKLGVSWRYMSRAELGENLTLDSLAKISEALHVTAKDLLEEPSPEAKLVRVGRPRKIR